MSYRITSKWVILAGAMSAQLAIGALYAWSLFNKPISAAWGLTPEGGGYSSAVAMTYAISLVSFSLCSIISGRLQLIKGPRFTCLIGAALFSGGMILSSQVSSPTMLYLTYGLMGGAGAAFVYVCPLSTLVKWFPKSKGTITGVATAGFAGGAILFKEVIGRLLDVEMYTPETISTTFMTLGCTYAVMLFTGALLLDVPEGAAAGSKKIESEAKDFKTGEMLRTANFYKLLFSDLLALMPGLLVIGLAANIGKGPAGLSLEKAAGVVSIVAIFNAMGRLMSGKLADKLGALNVYRVMYLLTILALAVLSFADLTIYPVFLGAVIVIGVCYGSFLSLVPTITGHLFGPKNFSANYSCVFQAYGMAAMLGITMKSRVEFNEAFAIAMGTAIAGLIIAMTIKENKKVAHEAPLEERFPEEN
jgi:OFA family oxalate/formate antiporter-like MFS transporter